MSDEQLGFELNVDLAGGDRQLSVIERSIESLQAAVDHLNQHGEIRLDERPATDALDGMQEVIDRLERSVSASTDQMATDFDSFADAVKSSSQMLNVRLGGSLDTIDRKLEQHERQLRAVIGLHHQLGESGPTAISYSSFGGGSFGGGRPPFPGAGGYAPVPGGGGFGAGGAGAMEEEAAATAGAGAAGVAGSAATTATTGNPILGLLGGVAATVSAKAILGYLSAAVAEQSEEYIRETNLSMRLQGTRSTVAFSRQVHGAGRDLGFLRGESMQAASEIGSRMSGANGINTADVRASLEYTRALGLEAGQGGAFFGRMGQMGAFQEGQGKRFAQEMVGTIFAGNMRPRSEEAMEAAASSLEEVSKSLGSLTDAQTQSVLGLQALFDTSGNRNFQGMRGAQMLNGMNEAIRPDSGDDTHEAFMNFALVKYGGMAGASPVQLLKQRGKGLADPRNLAAAFAMIRGVAGGNTDMQDLMLRDQLHIDLNNTDEFRRVTKGLTYVPKGAGLAKLGALGIQGGLEGQNQAFDGRTQMLRDTRVKGEELHRALGDAFFVPFKTAQDAMLGLSTTLLQNTRPAIKLLNDGLTSLAHTLGLFGPMHAGTGYDAPAGSGTTARAAGIQGRFAGGAAGYTPADFHAMEAEFSRNFPHSIITSTLRSAAHNAQLKGSAPNSYHLTDQAFDVDDKSLGGRGSKRWMQALAWGKSHGLLALTDEPAHIHFQPPHGTARAHLAASAARRAAAAPHGVAQGSRPQVSVTVHQTFKGADSVPGMRRAMHDAAHEAMSAAAAVFEATNMRA